MSWEGVSQGLLEVLFGGRVGEGRTDVESEEGDGVFVANGTLIPVVGDAFVARVLWSLVVSVLFPLSVIVKWTSGGRVM